MILPLELFHKIIAFLDTDLTSLYSCALVCRAFHCVATPLLYKRIHVSPPKTGLAWQLVEDTLGRKPFAASRLPSHVGYVEEFVLSGHLTKIRPSRQTPVPIIDKIPDALRLWHNLRTITLTPEKATGSAISNLVKALGDCRSLRVVTVNEIAMEDDIIPDLAQIIGLESVTLLHPTRAVFNILRDWLERLQDTLVDLRLLGNCGSLTPGILRPITPRIQNIRMLAIGLSYSLTNVDLFNCLSQLSGLQFLRLRYYRQYGTLPPGPSLPALRELTVLHTTLFSKEEADALSAWIRRISYTSPLERLETICSGHSGAKLCFDGLVMHIASKHHDTLCDVRIPKAYVRAPALQTLLNKCPAIRHIALTVAFSTLQAFPAMANTCVSLRTVTLDVCDNHRLVIEKKDALKAMQRVEQLRCLTVNGVTWKGTWMTQSDEEGNVTPEFVVGLVAAVAEERPVEDI